MVSFSDSQVVVTKVLCWSSNSTTFEWPWLQASYNGVYPAWSLTFGLFPLCKKHSIDLLPLIEALWSNLSPLLFSFPAIILGDSFMCRGLASFVCELSSSAKVEVAWWKTKGVIWYVTISPECDINLKSAQRQWKTVINMFSASTKSLLVPGMLLPHPLEVGLGDLLQPWGFHMPYRMKIFYTDLPLRNLFMLAHGI